MREIKPESTFWRRILELQTNLFYGSAVADVVVVIVIIFDSKEVVHLKKKSVVFFMLLLLPFQDREIYTSI